MKSHAFTLVELLVSLGILFVLLWLVPPAIVDFGETYQERVFIKQFENDLKLVQASAQATGRDSKLKINQVSQDTYTLIFAEDEKTKVIKEFPKTIHYSGEFNVEFNGETGNITTFNQFPSITFKGKKYSYTFTFQLGGGRYYVKVSNN